MPTSYSADRDRPAALKLHRFCGSLALLVWEGVPPANIRRLRVRLNGRTAKPPFTHLGLPLAPGRQRIIFALASVSGSPTLEILEPDDSVLARSPGAAILSRFGDELDVTALVAGLAAAERSRLARFLIEVCGFLFRVSADPAFVANIRTVLREITAGSGRLTPRCAFVGKYLLCEAIVPAALGERLSAAWITAGAVHRLALPPKLLNSVDKRPDLASLGIILECPAGRAMGEVVIFGDGGLIHRTLTGAPERLPNASEWLIQLGEGRPQHRRYLLDCLARMDSDNDKAVSLLRELRLLTPGLRPASAVHGCLKATAGLIIACPDGLFVSGNLFDPHRLVETLIIERDGVARTVDREDLAIVHAPSVGAASADEEAFVCFARERDAPTASANALVRLSLGLRSGARIAFADGPSLLSPHQACEAVLGAIPVPNFDNEAATAYAEAALRGLLREWLAPPPRMDVVDLGLPPAHPSASVVVPLLADTDLVRCRTGLFALDPAMVDVEVIYVAESAAQYRLAKRMLGDLRSAYGLPSRVIVPDRALPKAALLNFALGSARGRFVALLGPDAVPESPGWLTTLVSFLKGQTQRGIAGAQILNEDHSLASTGYYIGSDDHGRWALRPRLSGFPRDYASAAIPTRVAAVSADCLVISRALLEQVGGIADDYLLAQSACADLCLRVGALGREICRLPDPALFRIGRPALGVGETHYAACAEFDRRNLERRWRESFEAELGASGLPISILHPHAGERSTPAKRAA